MAFDEEPVEVKLLFLDSKFKRGNRRSADIQIF